MHKEFYLCLVQMHCGPSSSVNIVTGYVLESPGMKSRWGRNFPNLSSSALVPTQLPVQ
jgi:hypothetical protein